MKPTVDIDTWRERIDRARRRREQYETIWSQYARLHTNTYRAIADKNDDANVTLPSGDQVKASLVFRNIEQTLGLLEIPEVGIEATAKDIAREMDRQDTHREAVVEVSLQHSLNQSGLLQGDEEVDFIKRDGIIIGHAINYSWWRQVEREIENSFPVFTETEDGVFIPVLDEETGLPLFETVAEDEVIYEAVEDMRVSPLEFLFDSEAKVMSASPWHGMEKIIKLAKLKEDPRYKLPKDLQPSAYKVKNLYGDETADDLVASESVRLIVIWDRDNYELISLVEHCPQPKPAAGKGKKNKQVKRTDTLPKELVPVRVEKWPVMFSHPDDSPFTFFVPIPANDHPFGISQIEHIRNNAVEADKLRTRQANLTRQIKRIIGYKKGRLDEEQLRQALQGPDAGLVGLDIQDGEKWENLIYELPIPTIAPEIFQQSVAAEDNVYKTTGTPEMPFKPAPTATGTDSQMAIGGARPDRKRRKYLAFLTEVARRHLDFLREFAPSGRSVRVFGADGQPLVFEYGREAFAGEFEVKVQPGGESMYMSPAEQKFTLEVGNLFMGRFSPEFDKIFARQVLTKLKFRDINALLGAIPADAGFQQAGYPGAVVDGRQQEDIALGDLSNAQALRAAINAPNEGSVL